MKIISWNVNGIRACQTKGLVPWMIASGADCLCFQETKASRDQLNEEMLAVADYKAVFASAEKKGYSGVAAFVRDEPLSVEVLGCPEFDVEGRTMILEYPDVTVLNCYFPNSQEGGARLGYKVAFCDAILDTCQELVGKGRHILLCGDYNIAHQPIDLANPKQNEKNAGYLPEERAWMTKFLGAGFVDTFRQFCAEPNQYTWWSYRFRAREKNIGWRIDYHCVDQGFASAVRSSRIQADVVGSDHCPVGIDIEL
ncbi:MAG: exodeoxyribonuclease III [Epsilonproteobacteria bacterium]|nr:exodeoxyribonuclease III [Campylobacterota bacterium]